VLIADTAMAPGDDIVVRAAQRPLTMVPTAALTELPAGARLRQRVGAGEIITADDVTAVPGPASDAPRGTLVVAVVDPFANNVAEGLEVQVVAEGSKLAEGEIVQVGDGQVYVSVPAEQAPAVAAASRADLATLIYVP
jgi:hypothetical protein